MTSFCGPYAGTPPGLGGIIPSNAGGLGDPIKLRDTYRQDEVLPMQSIISQAINSDPEIGNMLKVKFLDTKKVE
ncbi:hypothetical protein [Avibacterium paragallinarum]|uniref:hypothetical protein n=1 Tax=Avibacterium paragallinarum TaxID=728 RepID=UPI002282530D|nr:hypothetical protein [Avibacterium paragallinarum]WAL58021.1 hypothetical protein OY678_12750 [Avibacterium paragallinarum]